MLLYPQMVKILDVCDKFFSSVKVTDVGAFRYKCLFSHQFDCYFCGLGPIDFDFVKTKIHADCKKSGEYLMDR